MISCRQNKLPSEFEKFLTQGIFVSLLQFDNFVPRVVFFKMSRLQLVEIFD